MMAKKRIRAIAPIFKTAAKLSLLLAFFGGLFFFYIFYQRYNQNIPRRTTYEGRVVDKWINVNETRQGSRLAGKVLVEAASGERFRLTVDPETYGRVEVGMCIKQEAGETQLWWPTLGQASTGKC
jgi:hypothetical protein